MYTLHGNTIISWDGYLNCSRLTVLKYTVPLDGYIGMPSGVARIFYCNL